MTRQQTRARARILVVLIWPLKSPFPALNVQRQREPVVTDTFFADVAAVDDGSVAAQLFVGRNSLVTNIYGMKSDSEFVRMLQDVIRKWGVMYMLTSDRAQVEISKKVVDILCHLVIKDWQSEPHYQHQNFAERRYQTLKTYFNHVMNMSGAPANMWLLCFQYICYVTNHTAAESLKWQTPLEVLTGNTPDTSVITAFKFYDPVYIECIDPGFPSESEQIRGRFVSFAKTVGHQATFKVLTDDTLKVVFHSRVIPADADKNKNLRIEPDPKDKAEQEDKDKDDILQMPTIDPEKLVGCSFLPLPDEDGNQFRVKIIELLMDYKQNLASDPHLICFRAKVEQTGMEEIIAYNDIMNMMEDGETMEQYHKFCAILDRQGPLTQSDPKYNGSTWNVQVQWETGDVTWEPLTIIAEDDPATCAQYVRDKELLDTPGWKWFEKIARHKKVLECQVNQSHLGGAGKPV